MIALVIALALVAACGGLVYYVVSQAAHESDSGVHQSAATNLRVGDCAQLPADVASGSLSSVTVMPCSKAHNAQVVTRSKLSDQADTSESALSAAATTSCRSQATDFLGHPTLLDVVALYPTDVAWAAGDRTQVCLIVDQHSDITGDVRTYA